MTDLSPGARFACWFAAYATSRVSLDDALDAITASDAAHHVVGVDGTDATATPLALALGALRGRGADHVHLALPTAGDPVGLAGPAEFNLEAVDAGEAVLLGGAGLGLVPSVVGSGVFWRVRRADRPTARDVAEADRDLRTALRDTADTLASLDVARWSPDAADALLNLRAGGGPDLPPGTDARAVALASTACRCLAIVDVARRTDGAAVTAYEADQRTAALRPLDAAARRGLAAACSTPIPR